MANHMSTIQLTSAGAMVGGCLGAVSGGIVGAIGGALTPLFKSSVLSSLIPSVGAGGCICIVGSAAGGTVTGLLMGYGVSKIMDGVRDNRMSDVVVGTMIAVVGIVAGFFVSMAATMPVGNFSFAEAAIFAGYTQAIALSINLIYFGVKRTFFPNPQVPPHPVVRQAPIDRLIQQLAIL